MFLKTTYQKIHKHRLYKDRQFHERLQNEKNIPIPFRLLALYLLFLRIGEAIFRFIIIIYKFSQFLASSHLPDPSSQPLSTVDLDVFDLVEVVDHMLDPSSAWN